MLKLRYYRIKANLSQAELARMIGATQAQVSQWENGLGIPRMHLLNLYTVLRTAGVLLPDETPTALGEPMARKTWWKKRKGGYDEVEDSQEE